MTMTRRDFLSAASAGSLALLGGSAFAKSPARRCIFLTLLGGPSQLDTWDPKPDAPPEVRGPFNSIQTRIPGVRFSELFPRMAEAANRFTLVRSMYHEAAPVHEAGLQLLQTGALSEPNRELPHFGAQFSAHHSIPGSAANIRLPGPIGFAGVNVDHGQSAGSLGQKHAPVAKVQDIENDPRRTRYGRTPFGDNVLRAARLIEDGTRFVTVNMFQTVYDTTTWDCHAAGGSLASTLGDYPAIAASFDAAFTALIEDLSERGLLESTLVIATGEFGRTPLLNRHGGRDHWAGVWTSLLAGMDLPRGTVIGESDRLGAEPKHDPVDPGRWSDLIRSRLGLTSDAIA